MVSRGNAHRRMNGCGCTVRAMVSISDGGELQALVCSDNLISREYACEGCWLACQKLNAALEARSFTQAAGLRPEQLHTDEEVEVHPQLGTAVEALHEALLQAILEFESQAPAECEPDDYSLLASQNFGQIETIGV